MTKVFLGGTCNGSVWRDDLIPMLSVDFYNPVVENWTNGCMDEEIRQREDCDLCLYTITSDMIGVFSIAEVVDDSNKRPSKTILCILENGFEDHELRSLSQVRRMVYDNGGVCFSNLKELSNYINSHN